MRARDLRLQRQYGITSEEYDAILAYQGGVCATCGTPPKEGKHLNVDHDHHTGLVRGLLCWSCNRRLIANHRGDKGADLLARGSLYLLHPPAEEALDGPRYGRTGRVTKRRRRKSRSTTTTKRRKR